MATNPGDVRATAQAGVEALRKGDFQTARALFESVVAAGVTDAQVYLGLGLAYRGLAEHAAALAAVDCALQLEPRNLKALMFKADQFASAGDDRAAAPFYMMVVKAAPADGQLTTELRNEVIRAQAMCDRYAQRFEGFLRDRLAAHGLADQPATSRFRQSLDIMTGNKKVFAQQPRTYYFPELPQTQFFDRNAFPWMDRIEAATEDIRAELIDVMNEKTAFTPYLEGHTRRPGGQSDRLVNNPDWSAFHLWKNGEIVPENAARCPKTLAALADVPLPYMKNRAPSIHFSLLRPGAYIPPHTGLVNTRLICHLPLIVPRDCALRVGNDTRVPVEGKAWLFDDTIEHEAWNRSTQNRVILLFECWRPELSPEERGLICAMFDAIDDHTGQKPNWTN
jgi:aspartyl/asparaginyl beta-hydroxylase (cupin superfamily)